jgi:hypothetical protein
MPTAQPIWRRSSGGVAGEEYQKPDKFFDNTYPTRGLQNLLANVCARLSGAGTEAAAIFRLDTSYGGGKTHGLIALVHAANSMKGVSNVSEFINPSPSSTGRSSKATSKLQSISFAPFTTTISTRNTRSSPHAPSGALRA